MLWLSQISFAGCGALVTGQIVTHWGWPVLPAILAAAVVSATAGAILGLLTVRLGDLYVALGTLSFGLLVETLVFQRPRFLQYGIGVTVSRPGFASGDMSFTYLALAVFGVFALLIINLRRSTTGMALRAVRDSQTAARTVGLSIVQMKVIVGAIGAFVAAVGGGFLAMYAGYAQPSSFPTFEGLIWLAVVVSLGIRSITAAAIAGLSFSLLPGIFSSYVPTRWAEVPALLFGLGAIGVARNPDGVIMQVVDGVTSRFSSQPPVIPPSVTPPPPPTPVDTDADPATQTQTQGDTGTISLREAKPAPKHRKVRS
jgi:branched-chain amino acid transport system permease protein